MKYRAVMFDLLSALLDSWSLWDDIAGSQDLGRRWRKAYLKRTYQTGTYRPYEGLVAESALEVGLPEHAANILAQRHPELKPWPEAQQVLEALSQDFPLVIVTNCSEALGKIAVECVGVPFEVVVTAERAGFYKPNPRPYRLALEELGLEANEVLFVAGSAFDLVGTVQVGLDTYWHNRIGMQAPEGTPAPMVEGESLEGLLSYTRRGKRKEERGRERQL